MTLSLQAANAIATAFTKARLRGEKIQDYPGQCPATLTEAYGIQDAAIELWPEKIAGWKVGGINGEPAERLGVEKLVGPIFENQVFRADNNVISMPVFKDGFAAVEAEIVFIINKDAPSSKTEWSLSEAKTMIGAAHIAVEIASSPFSKINDLGPLVTISDFGNNYGLIIGDELKDWESLKTKKSSIETLIDEQSVGTDSPPHTGGPLESLRYCLGNTALRGRPLVKGDAISTGAITGVHQAYVNQTSVIRCSGANDIALKLTAK